MPPIPKKEIVYHGGKLPTAYVYGKDYYKDKLLAQTGSFYASNYSFWRKTMAYMRSVGDREGERAIYMARFHYRRAEYSKGVLLLIAGFTQGVLTVEAAAAASAAGIGLSGLFRTGHANTKLSLLKGLFQLRQIHHLLVNGNQRGYTIAY